MKYSTITRSLENHLQWMYLKKLQISKLDNEVLKTTVVEQLRHIFTQVGNVDLDYIKKEYISFCRNQNLKQVILASVDLLKAVLMIE